MRLESSWAGDVCLPAKTNGVLRGGEKHQAKIPNDVGVPSRTTNGNQKSRERG